MEILSVHKITNGSAFVIADDIPTSLMVWIEISNLINKNFPNLYARVMPGPHAQTDFDIIEVITEDKEIFNSQVHELIEGITIEKSNGCKIFYKGQIITPG